MARGRSTKNSSDMTRWIRTRWSSIKNSLSLNLHLHPVATSVPNHPRSFVGVSQSQFFRDLVNFWRSMPTKWLQERAKGSKNEPGMPPHRGLRGPSGDESAEWSQGLVPLGPSRVGVVWCGVLGWCVGGEGGRTLVCWGGGLGGGGGDATATDRTAFSCTSPACIRAIILSFHFLPTKITTQTVLASNTKVFLQYFSLPGHERTTGFPG